MGFFVSLILFQGDFWSFFLIVVFFFQRGNGGLIFVPILSTSPSLILSITLWALPLMLCMSWLQVCIQCILGLIIGCLGVAKVAGEFREIRAAAEMANK